MMYAGKLSSGYLKLAFDFFFHTEDICLWTNDAVIQLELIYHFFH